MPDRVYRILRRVPTLAVLTGSLFIAVGPAILNFAWHGVTPIGLVAAWVSFSSAVYLTLCWRPYLAYTRATELVVRQHRLNEALSARAEEARERAYALRAALADAADPQERQRVSEALRATLAELVDLAAHLEPATAQVTDGIQLVQELKELFPHRRVAAWLRRTAQPQLVDGLTALAVAVAGPRGARMRDTWAAHLVGAPEDGLTLSKWQQVVHATGFVVAAIRMRGRSLADPLWRPIDWLLLSESRTRPVVTLAVGAQVIYIVKTDGLHGLLTEGWGWCGACAVALTVFFRWLRRVRGIELATVNRDTAGE